MRLPIAALLLAQLLAVPATAQVSLSGARVRATLQVPNTRVVGVFGGVSGDTLTLYPEKAAGRALQIPAASLSRLEVSAGRVNRWKRGAFIGGFIGMVGGAVIGAAALPACKIEEESDGITACLERASAGNATLAVGGVGLVIGAASGYLVGVLWNSERWEPLALYGVQRVSGR